ncbi:malonate decarboxylase holo-ACP synthase [Paraburkholderia sp. PREW-6R]|uniref:malonate decarboxylase holo-ACP synthase n=1 Tax=Paraburkholderia sp. PREW-6R TaxID=3141544 RepID=UPI0031F5699F
MRVCATAPFAAEDVLLEASAALEASSARWRPHDLLRLRELAVFDGEPAWVRSAFERAPYAVVRRALSADGFVAIGVRGELRSQRYGTWSRIADIDEAVPPEALAHRAPRDDRGALPAFVALAALAELAAAGSHTPDLLRGLAWGPAGSAGFELATGVATATASSDLDLLIRAPRTLTHDLARALLDQLEAVAGRAGVRIDAQLETPAGGVALAEWAAARPRVLARHASGPQLVADPWASAAPATQ